MVKSCCIKGCGSESVAGCNISFHSFPSNVKIKQMWLKVIPINVRKHSVVCSRHFMPGDFVEKCSRRMLTPNAVPSIFWLTYLWFCVENSYETGLYTKQPNLNAKQIGENELLISPNDHIFSLNKERQELIQESNELGPSSSQVSNLSQKYGSSFQSAVSCVYASGSGTESPPPEHTAPSGDGKHTQLKQQVKRKRSGDPAARQPESLACSECGSRVAARVYVCVQCVDARMCAACEPHAHASHAVVRLPSTRVYNIVRDLFESLQAQLNCRLRGLDDDAEDELMDDLDDDELDQYIDLPAVKKTKPHVIAPSTSREIIPPVALEVTSKTNPPASRTPTDETDEPMVMADAIKVEEQDPLRETAAEGFVRITSDIVKSERGEETVAEPKLAQVVRAANDTYIEINVPKSLVNESKLKIVNTTKGKSVGSNVTVVRKPKGKTAGNNVPVARKPTGNTTGSNVTGVRKTAGGNVIGNTSIERAQANKSGSEITMEIKQEPPEDACTEQVDSTGFIVFGSHRSIEGKNKKTS